jgi:hypothetical protein
MGQKHPFEENRVRENPVGESRIKERRNGVFARAVFGAAFGLCLVIAGGISAAYAAEADDEEDLLPDQKLIRSILRGLGLRNGQEAGIEYKERPPLVVPPSRDLPPPQTMGSVAQRNPAWPVDPDEKRHQEQKKANAERKRFILEEQLNQISPRELNSVPPGAPGPGGRAPPTVDVPGPQLSPGELGFKNSMWADMLGLGKFFGKDEEEAATFTREPPRVSLTDPPAGYRTPSPAEPYGLRSSRDVGKKKVVDRQEEGTLGK